MGFQTSADLIATIAAAKERLRNTHLHAGTRRSLLRRLPSWQAQLDLAQRMESGEFAAHKEELALRAEREAAAAVVRANLAPRRALAA